MTRPTDTPLVLVCGLPSSGNRLVQHFFARAHCPSHFVHGAYEDGVRGNTFDFHRDQTPQHHKGLVVVIPERHPLYWEMSFRKRLWPIFEPKWKQIDAYVAAAKHSIETQCHTHGVKPLRIPFNMIWEAPEESRRILLEHAGLASDAADWPMTEGKTPPQSKLYDADAPYREELEGIFASADVSVEVYREWLRQRRIDVLNAELLALEAGEPV